MERVNKHAPLHVKRARASKSPWITPYLKKRMHDRDILKLKASRSKDANDWLQFNPFAPEPPITARADPGPFYPL